MAAEVQTSDWKSDHSFAWNCRLKTVSWLRQLLFAILFTKWFMYLDVLITVSNTIVIIYTAQLDLHKTRQDRGLLEFEMFAIAFYFIETLLRTLHFIHLGLRFGWGSSRTSKWVFDLFNLIDLASVFLG